MKNKLRVLLPLFVVASVLTATAQTLPDFTTAADKSINAVVHVKVKATIKQTASPFGFGDDDPFFQFFFGQPKQQQRTQPVTASGSGVIISNDGYIVTNNHVVAEADEIEVVLNDKRTFTANVIGTDPNTDLALLKISDAKNLQTIPMGDSDNLKVGEWVLAIGNPFNLTSTVTAGIVSAKARNINILSSDMKIESFIQTDAAVNPGNSGGALVNVKGELVGINTAIASQTGSYTGYSFAIPSSIVKKVVEDLKKYGEVQRAVLGITISDINDQLAKEKKINTMDGAYVQSVGEEGAAAAAGIKEGDIITAVDGKKVKSVAELQEQIARHAPGDKVTVSAVRDGKDKVFNVELKNRRGNLDVMKSNSLDELGASFQELSKEQLAKQKISNGIQVSGVNKGGKFETAGIRKNFIIRRINSEMVNSINDVKNILAKVSNGSNRDNALFISGIYPDGRAAYYAINLSE